MIRSFIDPATLKAVASLISEIADSAHTTPFGGRREFGFCEDILPCGCEFGDDDDDEFVPFMGPARGIGVAGFPKEDRNKVFGLNVRVDTPRREWFNSRWEFENARRKFDRLVDAAEDCDWDNLSNTAPLHRVNAIRRPAHMAPPMGINQIGESGWD